MVGIFVWLRVRGGFGRIGEVYAESAFMADG